MDSMQMPSFTHTLLDEASTQRLGEILGQTLQPGMLIALNGPLGAGKSTLSRALIRSWGITGTIKSPSYSWVESYSVPLGTLNHFDFYRFRDIEDWEAYGFDSYFDQHAIALIEWPEKVATLLPPVDLTLQLDYHDSGRQVTAHSFTSAGNVCLIHLTNALKTT